MTKLTSLYDRSGERKYLNKTERRAFLKASQKLDSIAEKAFCLLLFFTGCRISEALALSIKSLDDEEGSVVFKTLKQRGKRRFRAVPIPPHLGEILTSTAANTNAKDPLWRFSRMSGWRLVKRVMNEARIAGVKSSPKGLRHGFAIACVSEGVPITMVQRWLGHSRLETTSIYLDFVGEDERDLARKVWNSTLPAENKKTRKPL